MKDVLVVEDDPTTAELVGFVAQTMGYRPIYADTMCLARGLLEKTGFCLVLLDIELPDGNGMDLCRWLRTFNDHTPVLVHSGTPVSRQEVLEAGADDLIPKDLEALDRLQDTVKSIKSHECPAQ